MKLRVIEDGNGVFKLQSEDYEWTYYNPPELGAVWKTIEKFKQEYKAVDRMNAMLRAEEERRLGGQIKRVIVEGEA